MLKYRGFLPAVTTQKRANAGEEFFEAKWFREVIVRAQVQASDPIPHGIARAQNSAPAGQNPRAPFAQQI